MAAKRIKLEDEEDRKVYSRDVYLERNLAGDRRAAIIESRHNDIVLRDNGYPISTYWSDHKVEQVFGQYSKQQHMLEVLQLYHREHRTAFLRKYQLAAGNSQICCRYQDQPFGLYVTRLTGCCRDRFGGIIHRHTTVIYTSRLIAAMKLPYHELWKAVLPRKDASKGYVFEGSGRCNLYGHKDRNHCVNPSHLNMETSKQNGRRKKHHRGVVRCDCRHPCIGYWVRVNTRGGCCDNLYSEAGCMHAHGVEL